MLIENVVASYGNINFAVVVVESTDNKALTPQIVRFELSDTIDDDKPTLDSDIEHPPANEHYTLESIDDKVKVLVKFAVTVAQCESALLSNQITG